MIGRSLVRFLAFVLSLAGSAPAALPADPEPAADRFGAPPNPFASDPCLLKGRERADGCAFRPEARLAAPQAGYVFTGIEDSSDVLGTPLGRGVSLGLSVDLLGPAELPETSKRLIESRRDPFAPQYYLPSFGMKIGF